MASRRRPVAVLTVGLLVSSAVAAVAQPGIPADPLPLESTIQVADAPLVADAGNSAYVPVGEHAVLHGTSFGGTPPYSYRWDIPEGQLLVPDNATAVIDTADLAAGTYLATLHVTDGAGDTASARVAYTVAGEAAGEEVELFNESVALDPPAVASLPFGPTDFEFEVPDGMASITGTLTWTVPANDYDLHLLDPNGDEQASSTDFIPDDSEVATVTNPVPGTWTARVERFATAGDPQITVTVVGVERPVDATGDPRPSVDIGGPYGFVAGDQQLLRAEVEGADAVRWDLNLDGVFDDATGAEVVADLPPGRHLVQVEAVAGDHRVRQMTSVRVARSQAELDQLAVPFTVIGVADSGINPYHLEFSAAAYPDAEVLELTRNFTRHPSEYLPGFPEDAPALPITQGQGYFPEQDIPVWEYDSYVKPGQVYWIPGTKIIGAIDAGGFGGSLHPILDDNGHGTGSASVAAGNRYGYCPTCLLVVADSLSGGTAAINQLDWVDISTNSWGYVGGLPLGYALGGNEGTLRAVERGQTVLFAAGNGMANTFFDVPILTYGSDYTGPDWVVTVGAIREDSQGAIISDGVPAHVSNLGDGDLPSACRTGDTGQCAFGGTSAATPYTAGVFGHVLTEVRRALGDHSFAGQRDPQRHDVDRRQVIAKGTPVPGSDFLSDGQLSRQELRAAVLKTAEPRYEAEQQGRFYPLPQTWNLEQAHYVFEGYGTPGPAAAERAIEVLLGQRALPDRSEEDEFFLFDCQNRDAQYGSFDRNGDGKPDSCEDESEAVRFVGDGARGNDDPRVTHFDPARKAVVDAAVDTEPFTYWLHRAPVHAPTQAGQPPADLPPNEGGPCAENFSEMYMDRTRDRLDTDVFTCFDSRITSTIAPYRPKGIFAAKDVLHTALPAGSRIDAVVYMKSQEPTATALQMVVKATDRAIARSTEVVAATNPVSFTEFRFSFETDRAVAPGEQLSLHFVHAGARSYAYGYGGHHASRVTITPAKPGFAAGLEFGVTIDALVHDAAPTGEAEAAPAEVVGKVAFPRLGEDPQLAGFHPVSHAVQVSVDDPDFRAPQYAQIDPQTGIWRTTFDLAPGEHTVYARALRDRYASPVTSLEVVISPEEDDEVEDGDDRARPVPPRRPVTPPGPPPSTPPSAVGSHTLAAAPGEGTTALILLAAGLLAVTGTLVRRELRRRPAG